MVSSIKITDSLVSTFEEELFFIKKYVYDFAKKNPGVSSALGISEQAIHDPNISRLIESVALLNAGMADRINNSKEELYGNLLDLIYPHYLRVKPAFTMLKLNPDSDLRNSVIIPEGTSFEFRTSYEDEEVKSIFRTGSAIKLYPYFISSVSACMAPFDQQYAALSKTSAAMLMIDLQTNDSDTFFSDIGLNDLELFLNGDDSVVLPLYDNFYSNMSHIVFENNGKFKEINLSCIISPFDIDTNLLPFETRSFIGFQILADLFLYTDAFKRLCLNIKDYVKNINSNTLKIYFFFNKMPVHTIRNLKKDNINLFCVPVFNLYKKIAEPLLIDHKKMGYEVMIDSEDDREVMLYAIEKVTDITQGKGFDVPRLYEEKYEKAISNFRWQLSQHYDCDNEQHNIMSVCRMHNDANSKDFVTLVLELETLCCDKIDFSIFNLNTSVECIDAIRLPAAVSIFRAIQPLITLSQANIKYSTILSHLQFNYNAVFGSQNSQQAFKKILSLYNFSASPNNQAYIDSIKKITRVQTIAPVRLSGVSCHTFGTVVDIHINSSNLMGCSVILFAQFLDRFFSYFSTYNTFVQVVVYIEGSEKDRVVFPRRSGCKVML